MRGGGERPGSVTPSPAQVRLEMEFGELLLQSKDSAICILCIFIFRI